MQISGKPIGELEDKRVYLTGVRITGDCPACKREIKYDLEKHPISYPTMNKKFKFFLYCNDCSHEWSFDVILKVELVAA